MELPALPVPIHRQFPRAAICGGLETSVEVVRRYKSLFKGFVAPDVGNLDRELQGTRLEDGGESPTDVAYLVAFLASTDGKSAQDSCRRCSTAEAKVAKRGMAKIQRTG